MYRYAPVFENDVKAEGTKPSYMSATVPFLFENDVKAEGTKRQFVIFVICFPFENDVKVEATKRAHRQRQHSHGLRMM